MQYSMTYYDKHVFFCTNDRGEGADRPSCARCGSVELRDYAKKRIKQLNLAGEGKIRINSAGCLDRCEEGPSCVVYPEGVWYTFIDELDVDEIIESHLIGGKIVERLKI
jgi:(2Fe-2S) ferredoxin